MKGKRFKEEQIIRLLQEAESGLAVADGCRKHNCSEQSFYRWSKEFLEAGKKRLAGDTTRGASSDEVKELRSEAAQRKEALAETLLENRLLKKSTHGAAGDDT